MTCDQSGKYPPARGGRNAVRLADLQPDETDRILLTLARHFFRSIAHPECADRRMAVAMAELTFGQGRGTAMAAALFRAIEAMRMARRDPFFYNDPNCPGCAGFLTQSELYLFQTLRAVRAGRASAASANAMLLCAGNDSAPFLDAVSQLFRALSVPHGPHDTGSGPLD